MSDKSLDVLVAIKQLASNAGVTILDYVADDAPYPRVTWGPDTSEPWDADAAPGHEGFIQIDVWSRALGRVECKQIMATLYDAIHDAQAGIVLCQVDNSRTLDDPDGITTHGVLRVHYLADS